MIVSFSDLQTRYVLPKIVSWDLFIIIMQLDVILLLFQIALKQLWIVHLVELSPRFELAVVLRYELVHFRVEHPQLAITLELLVYISVAIFVKILPLTGVLVYIVQYRSKLLNLLILLERLS